MDVVVIRTKLREGKELAYEEAHRVLPGEVRGDLVARGIRDWKIFRDGRDLIHVITAEPSFEAFRATPSADPEIGVRHHERMSPYLEPDQGSSSGPMKLVWDLDAEL
ncbi:L-rhamnose mutarotase [Saccharothrix ecbatanensis]|uniref:L-rhamnose mutarotase n=1 Tax=Saccharothrix ecbatanensis TaxID=1105145 RepID=A0A7W9M0Z8_9PSEU|nr:L-rhamnose mutarotase [Saccharothrix ecbatanensis]MBB5803381.1 L-rhamnose mutarotase [Saccharothrix ecbatanensis]